jgi:hypothetical protein
VCHKNAFIWNASGAILSSIKGVRIYLFQYHIVPSYVGFERFRQVGRAAIRPPRLAEVLASNFG